MKEFVLIILVFILMSLPIVVGVWKIYQKAGKPGWAAIVPVYNFFVLLEISDMPVWLLIFTVIPPISVIASPIIYIFVCIRLSQNFGKNGLFAIGMLFLPFIFFPLLAFGKSTYKCKYVNEVQVAIDNATDKIIQERLNKEMSFGNDAVNGVSVTTSNNTNTYVPTASPVISNANASFDNIKVDEVKPVLIERLAPDGLKKCNKCGTIAIIFNQKVCSNCGEVL